MHERFQLLFQHTEAVPLHKRAQKVHAIGGGQLSLYLGTDARLVATVDEQRARRQRDLGSRRRDRTARKSGALEDLSQQLSRLVNEFFRRGVRRDCENRSRDPVSNLDLLGNRRCVVTGHGCKGTMSEPGQMRSEYLKGIGRVERPAVHQFGIDVTELIVESRSDELLIEPARKPLHAKNLRSWVGQPQDAGSDGVTGLWEAFGKAQRPRGPRRLETAMSDDAARVQDALAGARRSRRRASIGSAICG